MDIMQTVGAPIFIAGSKFKVSAIRVSADGSIYVTPF